MTSVKRLYRSSDNRVFAGICGGLGEYFDVDPTVVRVVYVLLSLLTAFMGILLYPKIRKQSQWQSQLQ